MINAQNLSDFNYCRSLEWIETNGIGGYASGTVSGANTRSYHGLLVAAMHPPVGRMVVVSKLEETIVDSSDRIELSSNQYTGAIHPEGYQHLKDFSRDLFPTFIYQAGDIQIKKTVASIYGENSTIVLYEVLEATRPFTLELLPLYAYRDFHATARANDSIRHAFTFMNGIFQTSNYDECPALMITIPGSTFTGAPCWYYNFELTEEKDRGLDFIEDLYTHGRFKIELNNGGKVGVILSLEVPGEKDAFKLFEKEKARREKIVAANANQMVRKLTLAADQFIVSRGDLKTVIAGYHWFADWGRDTMISLPGLCLVTRRFEDARNILKAFANSVSEGMLPNRFPDYDESPEYNTIDATLWYFHAVYKYYQYTRDTIFVTKLLPVLIDIIDWHEKGTRYDIRVDPLDGLLAGGEEGVQLTWMDAKVDGWVVTPRKGKAVEINALWYNALCVLDFLTKEIGHPRQSYAELAQKVHASFNDKFWNSANEYLFDVIDGDKKDDTLRPNALYAISLPFPLLDIERSEKILTTVDRELVTPRGLRSLSPSHPAYEPFYHGDRWHRDSAYHQGTVWSFLLGIYVDALVRIKPDGKQRASALLNDFWPHFDEAGLDTISEIFDGNAPHAPRGCIAQAWSVAEILRVCAEHNLLASSNQYPNDHVTK